MINRILIVGLGSIGQRHLKLARSFLPNADIRIFRHKATYEVPKYSNGCFSCIDDAIAFEPQIAIIANPAPFHIDIAQTLANIGTHLLIEKPLSDSMSGVGKLIETCRSKGNLLLIGYNLRYLPSLQRFRELLGEQIIGKVLSVRCEVGQYLPSWRPDTDYRDGVSARHDLGGGVLLELSHELDYLRWIFGEVECVEATLSRQSSLEIDVEDTAHLTLEFMPATDGRKLIGTVNMDFIRHDTTRICTAIGELGSLRWNGLTGEVSVFLADSGKWRRVFKHSHPNDESYISQLNHLITCINENKTANINGEDGIKVLQIIEAARESSLTGVKVNVKKNVHSNVIT